MRSIRDRKKPGHHVYVDAGISGAEFANRPGFLRLMNAPKQRPPFSALNRHTPVSQGWTQAGALVGNRDTFHPARQLRVKGDMDTDKNPERDADQSPADWRELYVDLGARSCPRCRRVASFAASSENPDGDSG